MGSCVSMPERRIVLLGRRGDGKSSAGNTILGEKVFTPSASGEGRKTRRYGRKIRVFETPGLFDTDCDDKEMKSEIVNLLIECAQGVDAFVIVLKVGKYTRQEMEVLQQRLNSLEGDVLEHTVILFTFGEQLEGQTIEEFLKANSILQELVDKCGGRCHVIDNKHWKKRKQGNKSNRVQVKKLLETIDKMRNKSGCFTNELLQKVEKDIQEEIENMDEKNVPLEEKREKAKKSVGNKMLNQLTGATTGALIGALMGALSAATFILPLLQTTIPFRTFLNMASAVVGARGAVTEETAADKATVPKGEAEKTGEKAEGAEETGLVEEETGEKAGGAEEETGKKAGIMEEETGEKADRAEEETGKKAGIVEEETGQKAEGAEEETEKKAGIVEEEIGEKAEAARVGAAAAIAVGVFKVSALAGAFVGGVTGWKAAEEADSVYDAMNKAAKLNYENATAVLENAHKFVANAFSPTQTEENKK
ncbi:GTPase IMAP family member 5-like [Pseudorasbora parva]|uniref:GTPase IMAP family member 5-like n=1 Tax=Pseudorasbora parva TaxID=51549 RepID=UPI00351F1FEE